MFFNHSVLLLFIWREKCIRFIFFIESIYFLSFKKLFLFQNTTIEFHDVVGELILKASLDFQQFPETYFYPATPSIPTTLTLVFK